MPKLRLDSVGYPSLSEADLDQYEREIGCPLPEQYRDLLLSSNGGRTAEDYWLYYAPGVEQGAFMVSDFLPLLPHGDLHRDLRKLHEMMYSQERWPRWFHSFANDPGGNHFGFELSPANNYPVWFLDHEREHEEDGGLSLLCHSYVDFINGLEFVPPDEFRRRLGLKI